MSLLKTTILVGVFVGLQTARALQFDDQSPYFSFVWGDGGLPANIDSVASDQVSPDGQTVTMFGNCGPIAGADFQQGFVLDWGGNLEGTIGPGEQFVADLNFSVQATGGTLAWNFLAAIAGEGMIDTSMTPIALNGQVNGAQFEFETPSYTQPYWNGFGGYLQLDWQGYSPTDSLSINVNSIEITSVAEPDSLYLAMVPLLLVLIYRGHVIRWSLAKTGLFDR
jgi:hypothetical protein